MIQVVGHMRDPDLGARRTIACSVSTATGERNGADGWDMERVQYGWRTRLRIDIKAVAGTDCAQVANCCSSVLFMFFCPVLFSSGRVAAYKLKGE